MTSSVWQQREERTTTTLPAYQLAVYCNWCWCCHAQRYGLHGRKHTSDYYSNARQGKPDTPVPIRYSGLLHAFSRHVVTPDGQTTLHFSPRFTKYSFIVVVMVPPTWSEKGMELIEHAPAPRTLHLAQQVPPPNTIGLRLRGYTHLLHGAVSIGPTVSCGLWSLCAAATNSRHTAAVCSEITLSGCGSNV